MKKSADTQNTQRRVKHNGKTDNGVAVSAIRAINTAITVEAIKAVLMSCDKWTMVWVYEEISKYSWKKDTLKVNLAQKVAFDIRNAIESEEFRAMTVEEKYTALTTREYGYALRCVENCTERDYDEIGLMLGVKFTRQHTPLHRWSMLLDAIDTLEENGRTMRGLELSAMRNI